ncbi:MAG: hypothetical protein KDK99_18730 [Verrucomicrobiales bacterium]|nr:hypothetical protein [Verrucomicrobiales bacterium]
MADFPDPPPILPPDSHPGSWQPPPRQGVLGRLTRLLLLIIILLALVLPFTPYAAKIKRGLKEVAASFQTKPETKVITREVEVTKEVPKEVVREVVKTVEVPAPPEPLPSQYISRKEVDVASLFNGITVKTKLLTEEGNYASVERLDPDAYKAEFELSIRVPKANQTLGELARINPDLPKVLPGLETMLPKAKVSPFYHKLYQNKTTRIQRDLTRLNKALDRHNFFDCETILEMQHPVTQRRVMLIQSEMDVVADGSDGDRMPSLDEFIYMSDYYQPFTSYAWAKTSSTPNPLLKRWEDRLTKLKAEYAIKGLSAERNAYLKSSIQQVGAEITDMKNRSSLIAEKDPFIVISLLFRGYESQNPYAPRIGDYAAVIHGGRIFPAICGDYGPTFKMGEASLLMAKTVNEKATPYNRPESDLKVTYVIFPGTGTKPWKAPDLAVWESKCREYLNDVGGIGAGYTLHHWEDLFKKPEPPVVEPTVTSPTPPTSEEKPDAASPTSPADPATPAGGATGASSSVTPAEKPAETLAPALPAAGGQ